jgi:hypothetical protein
MFIFRHNLQLKITPRSRIQHEKSTILEKFLLSRNRKVHYHVHSGPPVASNQSNMAIVYTLITNSFKINFKVIISSMCTFSKWSRPFKFAMCFPCLRDPGVDSASNRNEYQESSWGVKGGRRVRLQPYRHLWADYLEKMWEPWRLTTLWAFMARYRDSFTYFYVYLPKPHSGYACYTSHTLHSWFNALITFDIE